jgi:hypothetical protein
MPSWPSDRQLPHDILEAVRELRFEGQQRLICWLFAHFRKKAKADHLQTCLLELLARLRAGFVPKCPVGLLKSMLLMRSSDEHRRRLKFAEAQAELQRRFSPMAPDADPAFAVHHQELFAEVFRATLNDLSPPVRDLVLARMFEWEPEAVLKSIEKHYHVGWSRDRARQLVFQARKRLRDRFQSR